MQLALCSEALALHFNWKNLNMQLYKICMQMYILFWGLDFEVNELITLSCLQEMLPFWVLCVSLYLISSTSLPKSHFFFFYQQRMKLN